MLHRFLVLHMQDPRFESTEGERDLFGVKNVQTGSYAHLVSYTLGIVPAASSSWSLTFIGVEVKN